uniref:Uncharacterized protein n=1 Tax=Chelonoidis abingdonii TaxID=106734 RepID=A0A8C0GTH5_CHEAB
EFPTKLHADGAKLFCALCNVLSYDRWSVIVDHFASKKHKPKEDADQEEGRNKHRKTITSPLKYKTPSERECVEVSGNIRKCANIPLSKTDYPLVREFLDNRVQNGGAVPGRTQLTETYIPENKSLNGR